jgi:hypothetical protein
MGSKYTTLATSGYDSSPPADDGSQVAANLITWSGIKSKLASPVKTLADAINSALVTAFDYSVRQITSSDNTVAADHMKCVEIAPTVTTAITVSLGDATTMTNNYRVFVKNSSLLNQTVGRVTSGDTIDGVTGNVTLPPKSGAIFQTTTGATGYLTVSAAAPLGLTVAKSHISGLTYSNGTDAVNDIDIAIGEATDSTGLRVIKLTTAITKQLDAGWAVGTNAGGLDTGSIGNSDYYIWLIQRSDTGVVDALFSLSSTAPTMPSSYDYKRLIGWFKRVGATIVAFHTYETEGGGLEMNWDSPTLDVNLANTLTTAKRTDAVKVPLNFSTVAHLNVVMTDATNGYICWVYCPDQTDLAPSLTVAPLSNMSKIDVVGTISAQLRVRTSATGTIAARSNLATVDLYAVATMGFSWARRN